MLRKQELLKAHLQTWVIRSLTSEGLGEQQGLGEALTGNSCLISMLFHVYSSSEVCMSWAL